MAEQNLAFVPEFDSNDCSDKGITGPFSTKFDYILKSATGGQTYPTTASAGSMTFDVCRPYIHYNVNVGNLKIEQNITHVVNINSSGNITLAGTGNFGGNVTAPLFIGNLQGVASGNKVSFDIKHPKEKGKRIRHIVAEGPEPGIYIRGRLKDSNIIPLPDYWDGLVDKESITVTLTQIGYSQDLIVEENIEWGKTIYVKSGNGANINCYYEVWAARWLDRDNHDDKLHVVYEGESYDDYPGNNDVFWKLNETQPQFSVSGGF